MKTSIIIISTLLVFSFFSSTRFSVLKNEKDDFRIVAYYSGDTIEVDKYPVEKLTHIIYSFLHLKGNRLTVDDASDSLVITHLVKLKQRNPDMKVILSLGGWGGCYTCSDVFSTDAGRNEFAASVKKLLSDFKADGIDLDWEYPAIEGVPDHPFRALDTRNFTMLVQELRRMLGDKYEISFAAGGFTAYLEHSVEWLQVIKYVDYINLMSYDLTSGYSKVTGHHTPLYSSPGQKESLDNAVRFLLNIGVPASKIVIGAAFYARVWENTEELNQGLYQKGSFKCGINYRDFDKEFSSANGFINYLDTLTCAPYSYSGKLHQFATYDDSASVSNKTKYALKNNLGGIMFWELTGDKYQNGLLDKIISAKLQTGNQK